MHHNLFKQITLTASFPMVYGKLNCLLTTISMQFIGLCPPKV